MQCFSDFSDDSDDSEDSDDFDDFSDFSDYLPLHGYSKHTNKMMKDLIHHLISKRS